MKYIEIPMSAFLIIEPMTKECYGIDRHTISGHICDSVDARTLKDDPRVSGYCDENNTVNLFSYAMDTIEKILIPVSDEYDMEEFNQFYGNHPVDDISRTVLQFMYILTMNRRKDRLTESEEAETAYWEYVRYIRPEMLRLYIALQKNHLRYQCKITIGYDKPVVIDKQEPWAQMALENYLNKFLGVDSLKDAERELMTIYGKKTGVPLDKEETRYMWGTYQLLQTITTMKSNKKKSVTNEQSRFITDYLILNKMIGVDEADSNNIRVRLKHFLKNYDTLEELLDEQNYKTSPNNPDSKYGIYF
ncbi:hypothetical protein AB9N12_03375 [Bacteroides sp. AN502(2024)]|uniref:hypothetical protein n=1 Tax=Bacteroides sp. AN502(2024) TaxID=3160599 RepID=UPI003516185D